MSSEFVIYFNGQLWAGLYSEIVDGHIVRIGRYVFGVEPSAAEVYQWVAEGSPGLKVEDVSNQQASGHPSLKAKNPKRLLREIRKAHVKAASNNRETAAQACLRQQVELGKRVAKSATKQRRNEQSQQKFAQRRLKRKEKHRGH